MDDAGPMGLAYFVAFGLRSTLRRCSAAISLSPRWSYVSASTVVQFLANPEWL